MDYTIRRHFEKLTHLGYSTKTESAYAGLKRNPHAATQQPLMVYKRLTRRRGGYSKRVFIRRYRKPIRRTYTRRTYRRRRY